MRKIIVGAMVSMDGVMQAPGGPTEDQFGGWVMPYFDQEFGEELDRLFSEKFDLLLGRKTYEIFAAYWPHYDEDAPMAASPGSSRRSRSTRFRARAGSIRAGKARCSCATSPT
jgi:dihydrofolate reductase